MHFLPYSLVSLATTMMGVMTVGWMFVACNAAYSSLIFAIAAVSLEGQWLPAKIALGKWILPDVEIIFLFLRFVALPILGISGIHGGIIA